MARTPLRWRLTLLFGITVITVLSLAGWFLSVRAKSILIEQARLTAVALARSLAAASSNDFFSYNYVALEQKAEEAAKDPLVSYVILYDKEGKVASFSGEGLLTGARTPGDMDPAMIPSKDPRISLVEMEGFQRPGLDVFVPVSGEGGTWGTVRLGMGLDSIYAEIERMTGFILLLGIVSVALVWGISAWFTRRITVPLSQLVDASERVPSGDFTIRIHSPTGDELQDLSEKFNWMVEQLGEQREALQENLREIRGLKDFNDLVIMSIINGLITLDSEGIVTSYNRKAEEIFGVPQEKVIGQVPSAIWGDKNILDRVLADALSGTGGSEGVEIVWRSLDGREKVLEVAVAPIQENAGATIGHLLLFTDLTDRKALEERLRRADRLGAMGTLASGLAHEIRNPLTAVRTFVQMFPLKADQEDFRSKFNRIVPTELDRVNELLDNLLDLVRKPRLDIRQLDACRVIERVLETLDPEMVSRDVTLDWTSNKQSIQVLGDESYLFRGLHNILLNAVQAMPDGGVLTISAGYDSGDGHSANVVMEVSDTGVGIPRELISEIFNPFFTSKEKGTGLGLAVTNKIIEDQKGRIEVVSERGTGTTFRIIMPAA